MRGAVPHQNARVCVARGDGAPCVHGPPPDSFASPLATVRPAHRRRRTPYIESSHVCQLNATATRPARRVAANAALQAQVGASPVGPRESRLAQLRGHCTHLRDAAGHLLLGGDDRLVACEGEGAPARGRVRHTRRVRVAARGHEGGAGRAPRPAARRVGLPQPRLRPPLPLCAAGRGRNTRGTWKRRARRRR